MNIINRTFTRFGLHTWGVLGVVFLCSSPVAADVVVLKTGVEVSGIIMTENDKFIEIMNENRMVLKLAKGTISEVKRQESALGFEAKADAATEEGRYNQALEFYEQAITLGGDEKSLKAKIEGVNDRIIDLQLGGLSYDLKESRRLRSIDRFDAAEETLRAMVAKAPQNKEVLTIASGEMGVLCVARARKLVDSVQHNAAEVQFKRAIEFSPNDYRIYEELGDLYARKTITHERAVLAYLKALEVGKEKLKKDSLNGLHTKIADLYSSNNFHESAARHYRLVYNNEPVDQQAIGDKLINSLTKLASSGSIQDSKYAIDSLMEATKIAPENVDVQELLASLLLDSLEYDRAIEAYNRVLELRPARLNANEKLAYIYRLKREPEKEAEHLDREVKIDLKDYDSKVNYGDVLWRLGEVEPALEQYRNAKELDPDNPRALVALASAERKLGNYKEAREAIQEILNRFKTDVRANLEMGLVLLDEKNYKKAETFFTDTIEFMKTDALKGTLEGDTLLANSYVGRGEVALNTTGPGTATNDFNKAMEIVPDYPPALFSIGEALQKKFSSSGALTDLMEAEQMMLKARALDETNPDFALGLGSFYHKTLAQEDRANERKYHIKALSQYRSYVDMGGAQIEQVKGFIKELSPSEKEQPVSTPAPATADESTSATVSLDDVATTPSTTATPENSDAPTSATLPTAPAPGT